MFKNIKELDNLSITPFQIVTLLTGYTDEELVNDDSFKTLNNDVDEKIIFFLKDKSPVIVDIYYPLKNNNLYLNWAFVKEICKSKKHSYLNEIFSDTAINISLSHNLLNLKHAFDYKDNLIDTVDYYYKQLHVNIIIRIDSYFGNKFFIYKG